MVAAHDPVDVGLSGEPLPESAHLCLIFDDDQQRLDLVTRYLAAGLRRNELTKCFLDVTEVAEMRRRLGAEGVDVEAVEREQLTFVPAERAYCPDGYFDPPAVVEGLKKRYVIAEKAGYSGSRVASEMSWALKGIGGSERVLEYEALIGTIQTHFPHTGMCQYDARRFDGATLFKVLQLHPFMVAQGQIVRNPYYVRPQEYVKA